MRVTSQRPVAILAACLGLDVAELHRIAPYLWRELRMSIADDEPESAGELGLWFVAGRPPFATVRVMRSGLVVMPAHPNRAGEIEIASPAEATEGWVFIHRDRAELARRLPATLRVMAKQAKRRNCQGLAK